MPAKGVVKWIAVPRAGSTLARPNDLYLCGTLVYVTLEDLDKNYASHPNRQGSNAHKHDFDNGERVKSTPMYDNDKAQTREDKSTPGTLKAVKPFDPKRGGV